MSDRQARIRQRLAKLPTKFSDSARIEGKALAQLVDDLRYLSREADRMRTDLAMAAAKRARDHGNPLASLLGGMSR